MPSEKEIREIMEKAKKAASGGKGPPKEKPKPETKEKPPVEKKEPSATPRKEEKPKPQAPPPDPQTAALKSSIDRLTDVVGKLESRLAETEPKTEVITPGGETGKTKEPAQEELTPEQELAMLQQAQAQQAQQSGQGQVPPGSGNPLYIYLLGKTMDTVGKVLPAALQRGGGGEGGDSFSKVAETLVLEWLKRSFGGGTGGGDQNISVEQMKTMSNFQGMLLGSFFNTIKNLPKPMAEKIIEGAVQTGGGIEETIK